MANKKHYFPNLEGESVRRGVSKREIAAALGISVRVVYNKFTGKTPLTWPEADCIQKRFFPDKEKDFLFSRTV